jgi:hypothetical protein
MYTFTKSLLTKWKVSTTVKNVPLKPDDESNKLTFHQAFLPNAVMESLAGHINRHSDLTGLVQQWFISADNTESANEQPMDEVVRIWMLDNGSPLKTVPVTEELLFNNVGITQLMKYDQLTDFPGIENRAVFSMVPIPSGIAYNTGNFEKGGFYLVFQSNWATPIKLAVYLRHMCFVHNN